MTDSKTVDFVYDLKEESPTDFATYILPMMGVPVRFNLQTIAEVDIPRDGRIVVPLPAEVAADLESGDKALRFAARPGIPEPSTGRDRTVYDISIVGAD